MNKEAPKLLLVDDNPDNRFVLQQVICQYLPQCEVVTAGNTREGLAAAATLELDGALIDMQMPGMDGIEMCRRLKTEEATARIPVILMTAHHSTPELRAQGLEAGADDFIVRPIDNLELIARIKTILRLKRAEDTLRATNLDLTKLVDQKTSALRDYQKAVEGSQDLVVTVNTQYVYTVANDAFLKYHGLERNEVVGCSVSEVLGEGVFAEIKPQLDRCLAGEIVQAERSRSYRKLGQRYLETRYSPIMGAGGEIEGVVGIIRDITEHKQAEEALRKSQKKFKSLSHQFQTLLDGIPDALLLLSQELKVVWGNRGFAAHMHQEPDALSGQYCFQLWSGRSAPCQDCPAQECFRSGEAQETTHTAADGRIWGVKVFPLKDQNGKVRNVIKFSTDITEKIKLREEATRASRLASLGELSAGVAHEINNPNAVILLNAPLLMAAWPDMAPILEAHYRENGDFLLGRLAYSELKEEIPHLLAEMFDGAKRVKRIVEDLKDFARPDDFVIQEVIDLNVAVQAAVRLTANTLKKSTNRFVSAYGDRLPRIRGNFQRLEQVAVNLIVNACQALSDKNRAIYLTTLFDEARGKVVLEVRDEGGGIPPENLPHLTDPFFTTKRKIGGTGLGLSVSAHIVKEHGGSLDFISSPGEGTTASVTLPIFQEAENQ